MAQRKYRPWDSWKTRLKFRASPMFVGLRTERTRGSAAANSATIWGVRSVEALSQTISSKSPKVWSSSAVRVCSR